MPLLPGKSNIGKNITELEQPSAHAPQGRPYRQALAIALKTAGAPKRRADGGGTDADGSPPAGAGGFTGALTGDTPGRADALPVTVPDGAHVVPADVVSSLGGGNTAAGLKHLGKMFPAPKASAPKPVVPKAPSMPNAPHLLAPKISMPKMKAPSVRNRPFVRFPRAAGGAAEGVRCDLSDGEYVIHPSHVVRLGKGDAERGHRALDRWFMNVRRDDIEHRKRLPGPVGSGLKSVGGGVA